MKNEIKNKIYLTITAVLAIMLFGCVESPDKARNKTTPSLAATSIPPGATIGTLTEAFAPEFIAVSGFAIVGGLNGTGSPECPPVIRTYLSQYIRKNLPGRDSESFINSRDTAVVRIEGLLPTSAPKGGSFDIQVTALEGTQTTSLQNGQIYGAELRAAASIGFTSKILATVSGPIYIDRIDGPPNNFTTGYVLGGARVLDDHKAFLILREPDYVVASAIRNKLIERFGDGIARAIDPGQVEINIPARYREQKQRFMRTILATHLQFNPEQMSKAISEAVSVISGSGGNKDVAEIMLESIGLPARNQLTDLLDSSEQEVRLRAARCLLNIGRDEGFRTLRQIALDTKSPYRIDAIRAIMYAAKRNDAAAVARRLLRDADIDIRLEAYEQLRKFRDVSIDSEQIAGRFILEQVAGTSHDTIYVSRSGYPRIAIFGGPIYCKEDIFIQSSDAAITIDAQEGQNYVNVMRTMRNRPGSGPVTLRSSYRLTDIIRTLGADPISQDRQSRLGLAVPYAEIISMLKEMVEKDGVEAEFKAGPMSQISFK